MEPIYAALVYAVWFLSTYFIVLMLLILLSGIKLYEKRYWPKDRPWPMVSILAPAFNEEKKIAHTIASLKKITYPHVEFILLNDGSTDNTSRVVRDHIKGSDNFVFVDRKENKGKAATLNDAIAIAKGEYIACMDADSTIEPDIMQKVLPYFLEEKVGAVTASVRVKTVKSFVDKIIEIEYIIGLSLFLKVLSAINTIMVTPGPFSVYRRDMLREIGGFDPTNIVEDHEIAYRIHKAGYRIRNCLEATVETFIPETLKGLYVQRRRWYSGAVRTLMQHKDVWFNHNLGFFGYFAPLNQVLIFLGFVLFLYTAYLGISNFVENALYFRYADFDFLARILEYKFDFLRIKKTWFLGITSLVGSWAILLLGLKYTRIDWRSKKVGVLGYVFMFFLYQIFWAGAYLAVLRGGRVKWR